MSPERRKIIPKHANSYNFSKSLKVYNNITNNLISCRNPDNSEYSETVETEEAYIVFYNYLLLFFMLAVFIRYNNKNDVQKNINNKNQ